MKNPALFQYLKELRRKNIYREGKDKENLIYRCTIFHILNVLTNFFFLIPEKNWKITTRRPFNCIQDENSSSGV